MMILLSLSVHHTVIISTMKCNIFFISTPSEREFNNSINWIELESKFPVLISRLTTKCPNLNMKIVSKLNGRSNSLKLNLHVASLDWDICLFFLSFFLFSSY